MLNAGACGPVQSGADEVKAKVLAACRPRLITELRRLQPDVILVLGGGALKSLASKAPGGVTALRGALLDIGDDVGGDLWQPRLLATIHPAAILRGGDAEAPDSPGGEGSRAVDLLYYFLVYDLAKSWRLANGHVKPWVDDCDLFLVSGGCLHRATTDEKGTPIVGDEATADEFVSAMTRIQSESIEQGAFGCDVETDGKDSLEANLTAISFATKAGGLSATWEAFQRVPGALAIAQQMLAGDTPKWFWNRIYDCLVLPRHGLPVSKPIDDGLLLHHAAFPGLPHKLDQVAQQLLCVKSWKNEFRRSTKNEAERITYCYRDSQATILIPGPLSAVVTQHKTERVYEADRQVVAIAQRMRSFGFWIDRKEQERQSKIQHARLDYMRESLTKDFAKIEPQWRDRLARNLAIRQRQKDPDDFLERVGKRYDEIGRRAHVLEKAEAAVWKTEEKLAAAPPDRRAKAERVVYHARAQLDKLTRKSQTHVGLIKTKAKADLVALFEVLRIPFTSYTDKGSPVTDKKAMEAAAAKHPLMRQLIHVREAQHILATYIDGLPIKVDGRVHPDWSVTKISGRWGAGKIMNVPKQIAGWPPEIDPPTGAWRRRPSGDYICAVENPRAIISAPTVDEILAHALDNPEIYEDTRYRRIYERALGGYGRRLVGADMSQVELRYAALLGKDEFLIEAYNKGKDVHAMNARVCFPKTFPELEAKWHNTFVGLGREVPAIKADLAKLSLDDALRAELGKTQKVWSKLRDLAKRLVYGWIYGGRAETIYNALVREFPELELAAVQEAFRLLDQTLVGCVAWRNRIETIVRQQREVRDAILNRARFFPLGNWDANVAWNHPIQAGCASIHILSAFRFVALTEPHLLEFDQLYAYGLLDKSWVEARESEGFTEWHAPTVLIANIHDSWTCECDTEDAEKAAKLLDLAMTHEVTIDGVTMRFPAEVAIGRRLSET